MFRPFLCMLIITQSKLNVLITTLTEKKVSATKIYLFEAVNQEQNSKVYCVCADVSISPNRYNQFCVHENTFLSGSTNPLNSEILLPLSGFYYYNIYENPNSVLSPVGLHQLETGKLLVLASKTQSVPVFVSAINPDQIVYNPEKYLK